jgi:hypothetical protein
MALSSRRQGLQEVYQKLITKGLPSLESVAVSTGLPLISFSCTEGSCADAAKAELMQIAASAKNLTIDLILCSFKMLFFLC